MLGLAALVGAHPYDLPSWMPDILVAYVLCIYQQVEILIYPLLDWPTKWEGKFRLFPTLLRKG